MATAGRRAGVDLAHRLRKEPYRFGFFQAVRLLEHIAREQDSPRRKFAPVGHDTSPGSEVVRFRGYPSRTFPPCDIDMLKANDTDLEPPKPPYEMTVTFMGLYGPAGVLPHHYTQMVIDEPHNSPLRDFLDVFNHRVISFFYRAWEKYRFPIAYERQKLWKEDATDLFTECMLSLVGLNSMRMRNRMEVDDETFVYYAGHYAHKPRNATGLVDLLREYVGLPLDVQQFQGRWMYLADKDRSCLPTPGMPLGQNNRLGRTIIVGERVWTIEAGVRIRIGPLNYEQFQQFMPGGRRLIQVAQLTRMYIGTTLEFDVQLVLRADEVPDLEIGGDAGSRLGMNTWLFSQPLTEDVDDPVFVHEGGPTR